LHIEVSPLPANAQMHCQQLIDQDLAGTVMVARSIARASVDHVGTINRIAKSVPMHQALPFILVMTGLLASFAQGADDYEQPPIEYSTSTPQNCVSDLQAQFENNSVSLKYEPEQGYLRDLLEKLKVDPVSQVLVFSKTSEQRDRIAPRTPRAIYFNDDVYVGYCHNGDVIELSVADSALGAVFYTVDQRDNTKPALERQTQRCLQCHGTSQTDNIPGFMMRSLYVDGGGQPILSEGGRYVDDTTPLADRWGGWYVTGKLNGQQHLGNLIIRDRSAPKPWRDDASHDVTELHNQISVGNYLTPHSDAVALMILSHQTYVHNLITKANFTARQALRYQVEFNRALGNPPDEKLESVTHRIEGAGDKLVAGLLFVDEAPIERPIEGNSGFAEKFVQAGPRDKKGRSLRDFDLHTRLFRYPCSYLIYSRGFDELPPPMKSYVAARLKDILEGGGGDSFSHLSADDRQAILEILRDTKPDLWAEYSNSLGRSGN
jgi:hypothetical protein